MDPIYIKWGGGVICLLKWTGCCCTCTGEGAHTERLAGTGSGVGLQLSGMEPRERTCRGPETDGGGACLECWGHSKKPGNGVEREIVEGEVLSGRARCPG